MHVEYWSPAIIQPLGLARSEGIHESAVLKNIAVLNGSLKPEYLDTLDLVERGNGSEWWDNLDQITQLRMAIGLAWEEWYIRTQLPHVTHQPGEICIEGLYTTPDGESLEAICSERGGYELALHEVKTTGKSINTVGENLLSQWMWLSQLKVNCKGLGTTLAYLHVLFLFADYSYPMHQQKRVYKIRFTQAEIDETWDIVTSFVRHRQLQEAEDMMKDTID